MKYLKPFAWASILSASLAIIFISYSLFSEYTLALLLSFSFSLVLSGVGIYSSVRLLKSNDKLSVSLLAIYWCLQIVSLESSYLILKVVSGINLALSFEFFGTEVLINFFALMCFIFALKVALNTCTEKSEKA